MHDQHRLALWILAALARTQSLRPDRVDSAYFADHRSGTYHPHLAPWIEPSELLPGSLVIGWSPLDDSVTPANLSLVLSRTPSEIIARPFGGHQPMHATRWTPILGVPPAHYLEGAHWRVQQAVQRVLAAFPLAHLIQITFEDGLAMVEARVQGKDIFMTIPYRQILEEHLDQAVFSLLRQHVA
jgi:hypothetical protein